MHGIDSIEAVGEPIGSNLYCFALREGDAALRHRLNEGLRVVNASGRYEEIYRKWFGDIEVERFAARMWRFAAAIAIPFSIIVVVMLLWSWTLRRTVKVRTEELSRKVSECEQAEDAARGSEALYRAIFEHTGNASILINKDTTIALTNTQWTALTGYTREECEGLRSWTEFVVPEDLERMKAYHAARRYDPADAPKIYEFRLIDRAGVVHDCINHVGMIPGTDRSVASILDITERKRAQEALREAHDLLEERVKERTRELREANEELKKFAYFVSHDLRAPLINLKGFSAELRSTIDEIRPALEGAQVEAEKKDRVFRAFQEDIPEALGFIETSVTRMDGLINAVLQLSRAGRRPLDRERIDMKALTETIIRSMEHQIEERQVAVQVEELPDVVADRISMEQIMGNLIDNAVKYLSPQRRGEVRISGERTQDASVFHVHDNGRGISREDAARIFELFRRVGAQDVLGFGMGLNYVQALVRRHGGRIWCESEPGVGTTFSFTIAEALEPEEERDDRP
jgi:PAS domain S-box-containing protein